MQMHRTLHFMPPAEQGRGRFQTCPYKPFTINKIPDSGSNIPNAALESTVQQLAAHHFEYIAETQDAGHLIPFLYDERLMHPHYIQV